MFYTGLLAKLGRCEWCFLLVVNCRDIEENSKFHYNFSLIFQNYFYFGGGDTVNEFMIYW